MNLKPAASGSSSFYACLILDFTLEYIRFISINVLLSERPLVRLEII